MIRRNYRKFFSKLGIILFVTLPVILLLNIIVPDRSFSEKENRVLSSFPSVSLSSLTSGRISGQLDDYVNDQFVLRDIWVTLKATVDRMLGKVELNGVYAGKHGYLLESFTAPSDKFVAGITGALTYFSLNHQDITQYMLLAPTSVNILHSHLPLAAPEADQNYYIDKIRDSVEVAGMSFIDVRDSFRNHIDDKLYYKTDHHWTTQGAYYAYLACADIMGLDTSLETYEMLPASKSFQGTLSAKSGFRSGTMEELSVFLPKGTTDYPYVVNYVDERKKVASFYATDKLSTRDKYGMFLNGNHAQIKISSPNAAPRTILILKDSYANSFIPFLAPHYQNIIVIDPRYYYGDLDSLIQAEGVDEVLFLYNANTFYTDNSLELLLSPEN